MYLFILVTVHETKACTLKENYAIYCHSDVRGR